MYKYRAGKTLKWPKHYNYSLTIVIHSSDRKLRSKPCFYHFFQSAVGNCYIDMCTSTNNMLIIWSREEGLRQNAWSYNSKNQAKYKTSSQKQNAMLKIYKISKFAHPGALLVSIFLMTGATAQSNFKVMEATEIWDVRCTKI